MAAVSIVEVATGTTAFEVGSYSRSRLHKFGVGWLTTALEQLWVYSGDVSRAKAEIGTSGGWTKSPVPSQSLPSEVIQWW